MTLNDVLVDSLYRARVSGYIWADEPVVEALMLRQPICHATRVHILYIQSMQMELMLCR